MARFETQSPRSEELTSRLNALRDVLRKTRRPLTALSLSRHFKVTRATVGKWLEQEAVRCKAVGLELRISEVREGRRGPKSYGFQVIG